ncbi:hypothetical protein JMJ77_0006196 [Colletotrichum scovillei]|uniref:Uncharacterized protein n=1 Tax=Colletotrichum scovillei TaxID=1209932 RepID=A0A9P7UIZ3_9PEZI|nr:hypothetical protein JMJ77_0006196 [Colletotrichum scovillei]KAG7077471.1 hypothetical protein JMJ76_0014718 [Colletotrichum scovillei]KAG7084571.1 hypothetical protein JMJ78_0010005 [Colletotrichum scovillei]
MSSTRGSDIFGHLQMRYLAGAPSGTRLLAGMLSI